MALESNHPKNQHYVPQFLLGNFVDESELLHVFDKTTGKSFRTIPRNIAAETGFYDFQDASGEPHSLEYWFRELEGKAAAAVKHILDLQSLSNLPKEARIVLSIFAAVQQLRVKGVRHRLKLLNEDLRKEILRRGIDPGDAMPEITDADVKQLALQKLGEFKTTAQYFFGKSWVLQRAPADKHFFISDNPITLHNVVPHPFGNVGLSVPGVEIYLPLSPEFSIMMLCPQWHQQIRATLKMVSERESTLGPCPIDASPLRELAHTIESGQPDLISADNVTHQNSLQVANASRFIIADGDDFELVHKMLERDPRYKEPPRMTIT